MVIRKNTILHDRSWTKMDLNIITYLTCICLLFIFGRIFIIPLKKILKLIMNSIFGGICIYVINLIGSSFGFHIGLNFFTSILIRIIRITRCCLLNCCKTINWHITKTTAIYGCFCIILQLQI